MKSREEIEIAIFGVEFAIIVECIFLIFSIIKIVVYSILTVMFKIVNIRNGGRYFVEKKRTQKRANAKAIAREKAIKLVDQMNVEEMASQLKFDSPAIERLQVPAYNWWNEALHGVARAGTATVFPQAIALGATFDEDLLEKIADTIADETRAKYNEAIKNDDRDIYKGITMWSPNVNLFRDPRWGRGHETYGEDPELISRLGVAFINGLQGDGEYLKTAACAKHFAVHSGPEEMRHYFDAVATEKDLWETYLPAFEACVKEADVESVMGAYNRTNGEPCCANGPLMEDILRDQWGFDGYYVSDCWAIRDFHENHKVTKTPEDSIRLALDKGCDLNCGCTYQNIMRAYKEGDLPLEHIRRAAINLFTTRYLLGMFDETEFDQIPYEVVECKEHIELSKTAAEKSFVLLKNDGILPLKKGEFKTIGVIGPNADSRRALMGNYHGTASRYVTVLEGIQDYVGDDARVLYSLGCHLFQDREEPLAVADDRLAEAKTVAAHSDVIVLCLGLDETLEGEEGDTGNAYASGDKLDLQFPASQQKLLDVVIAAKKPCIILSMTGSAMDLAKANQANAVMQIWYPGARGGEAVAKTLFGEVSPSAKLPVTFYRDLSGLPEFPDYSMKGRTYRYITNEPMYPFGYGLTYGDTSVVDVKVLEEKVSEDEKAVVLSVSMKNTSAVETEDILQVYVHVNGSENEVDHAKLAAFKRVKIGANSTEEVQITVPGRAFSVVNEQGQRVFEGTSASVYVGFGQPDNRTKELTGKESICVEVSL